MNMKKYFIAEDDEQKGPFSFNELKEMGISKTTLIWKEGFDDWTEAGKIENLQSLLKITPPKLPKSEGKKKKTDQTLNVNLGIGKPKTILQLKEKELVQEKLKANVANTVVYYLKNILISIFLLAALLIIRSNFVSETDLSNAPDPVVAENYNRISTIFEYIGFIVLFICFYIIFQRPIRQIYNWFKKYSEKEI